MHKVYSLIIALVISVPALGETTAEQQWHSIKEQLAQLENCEETQSCPQDPTNPRNSFYLLGEQINGELDKLAEWQQQFGVSDESRALLHHYLLYPNEFVQTKAVQILAEMSADDATAEQLLTVLPGVKDKQLLIPLLVQLQRYPHLRQEIDGAFAEVLQRGSFNAAKVLAQHIQPFLTAENLPFYQQLLEQLPANSAKARALEKAIDRQMARNKP
ncbi:MULTISPECIES: hypothetical protein [unclassified Microbulbifer]|uniref:hypothetical protein n=1 Tax=unclassified Microbulbifer TaxID=2619833 RepID=UPI0027E59093|nr:MULTISPECIES: hypothetical protein [unclassified Microbulbifer]